MKVLLNFPFDFGSMLAADLTTNVQVGHQRLQNLLLVDGCAITDVAPHLLDWFRMVASGIPE